MKSEVIRDLILLFKGFRQNCPLRTSLRLGSSTVLSRVAKEGHGSGP